MGLKEKRWLENLKRLEYYIINKFDTVKLGVYVDVEEVMKLLYCSRVTAYNYLKAVAVRLEKNGAVLKRVGNKLLLFPSEHDYNRFIEKINKNSSMSIDNASTTTVQEIKVKCHKCGYEWITRSKMAYVTCPSCSRKVKNPNKEFK